MTEEFDRLLITFSAGTIREKHDTLRRLIAIKAHNKASKDNLFKIGVDSIAKVAADTLSHNEERLLAVSILSRIWSIMRSMRSEYKSFISEALKSELPNLHCLVDADDRAYVGKACALTNYDWIANYASKVAVYEESGEQARVAFLVALLKSTKNLDLALSYLKTHISKYIPNTEEPGNTVVKRLRRILGALRTAIAEEGPEAGDKPGDGLHDLVKEAFSGVPPSTDVQVIAEAVEEIAGLTNEIIRLRFSLATQPSTYKVFSYTRKLIPGFEWEKIAKKSRTMKYVVQAISESILILSRQSIPADDLVNCLVVTIGNNQIARDFLFELAKKPGLSPAIKNWLVNGIFENPAQLEVPQGESQTLNESIFIADLLIDSMRYRNSEQIGRKTILGELDILNPNLSQELRRLLNYGLGLCDSIESLARNRGMRVCDKIGNEADYSPADHDLIAPGSNTRKVRIIRPPVDQILRDGVTIIIRKGLVESIN
jgi:hypothetical protein